jgi:hypothetical protein
MDVVRHSVLAAIQLRVGLWLVLLGGAASLAGRSERPNKKEVSVVDSPALG